MPAKSVFDQMGSEISIPFPPKRIISLVPSQTELLASLGLEQEVVGITKFCVHPREWRKSKAIIGGTKNFNFEAIQSLNPDLIIGNKEENCPEGIERLKSTWPVWMSDIITQQHAFDMMKSLGEITGRVQEATILITEIQRSFNKIILSCEAKVLYLIWRRPWMGAAAGTFIHDMLSLAGFKNCLANHTRYPEIPLDEMKQLNPDLVFLSSEPYPFKEKHVEEVQALLPKAKIILVDGEMFSWYGSRMLLFPEYLSRLRTGLV